MLGKTLASVTTLIGLASAQVAPGFPISAPQSLGLTFAGNNTVDPPGELIPRGDTAQPPVIRSPVGLSGNGSSTANARGVLLIVDLDVPRNGSRVQLVHYFSSNVTMNPSTSLLTLPAGEVPYLQPSPPVGDSPHAYTFILFSQPAGFSVPSQYANLSNNRVPFNVAQFASDTKLTQALAANYIRVQNLTGSATQSFPAPRPTGSQSASGPAVFPGGASQMVSVNGITFWAGLSTAMLVGFAAIAL